ncbi:MAG: DUF445 family protein [Halanaerobiales bacterium]
MDFYRMILELMGGALTGYITNTLAIKMLFKNYGPFGGVIVKTRDEFIENISNLVERDIINENTLGDSLNDKEVKDIIRSMVGHFFGHSLENRTENLIITEIPGIKKTSDNFLNFLNRNTAKYYREAAKILLPQIELKDAISDPQFDHIEKESFEQMILILNNSEEIRSDIYKLISGLSEKKVNNLFHSDLINILSENLKENLEEIVNSDYIYNQLNELIYNLEKYIDTEGVKGDLFDHMGDKQLKEFGIDKEYLSSLMSNIQTILNSSGSQAIIKFAYDNFLNSADNLSLSALLGLDGNKNEEINNPDYADKHFFEKKENIAFSIIDKKTQGILNVLKLWIHNNQSRIDEVFDNITIEVLEEESERSPWKSAIKKSAYEYFKNNNNQTPTQILEEAVENISSERSYHIKLLDLIKDKLDNVQVDNLLSDKDPDVILNYLNDYIDNIENKTLEKISEYRINELISSDQLESVSFHDFITDNIDLKKIILQGLASALENDIDNIKDCKLSDLLNMTDSETYYKKILSLIIENKRSIEKSMKSNLTKKVKDKTLDQLMSPDIRENLAKSLHKSSIKMLKNQYENNKNKKVNVLIHRFSSKDTFNKNIARMLIENFSDNLPLLLKGNISAAIKNNLIGVSDKDMENLVEGFVGRELKPITYFGAFLGLCSASLLYLLQAGTGLPPSLQIPLSMLVYGFIGYMTNVIAIKMVFKPYYEKRFMGFKLPFTPGVVSKEKIRFAHSIGRFIDQELLNYQTVRRTIQNKKEKIIDIFIDALRSEDYLLLRELLENNHDTITQYTFDHLIKNKSRGVNYLVDFLDKPISKMDGQKLESLTESISPSLAKSITKFIKKNCTYLSRIIADYLEENQKKKISSILSDSTRQKIEQSMTIYLEKRIDYSIDLLAENPLSEAMISHGMISKDIPSDSFFNPEISGLSDFIKRVYGDIKSYQINDLPEDVRETLSNLLYTLTEKLINSQISNIRPILNGLISSEFNLLLDNATSLLAENKEIIKVSLRKKLGASMGFWAKAGKLVDIDLTLDRLSERIVDKGIPEILDLFLDEKTDETLAIVDLTEKEVSLLLNQLLGEESIREIYTGILDNLMKKSAFTLENLFEILEVDNPAVLIRIFSEEITLIKRNLTESLKKNKAEIIQNIMCIINNLTDNYIYNLKAEDIIRGLNEEVLKDTLEQTYKQINENNKITNLFAAFIREYIILNTEENTLINSDYLKKDLNKLNSRLLHDPIIFEKIYNLLDKIYLDIINQLNEIIDNKSADYLINLLVESLMDTIEEGLPELIREINIKEITIEEIENMDPREIETLFYAFAGNYFGKLELYGWMGGIIGLLAELINLSF